MKYETMTIDQMQRFVRQMDTSLPKLIEERERILAEIKGMQDRKVILSWEEIASAVAYPKAMSDKERVSNGFSDDNKLLGQLERINKIYISQMEELCEELETVEMKVAQIRYVNRCIGRLPHDEREIIEAFTRKDITYERASRDLHMTRNTLYKLQKRALEMLIRIYNSHASY